VRLQQELLQTRWSGQHPAVTGSFLGHAKGVPGQHVAWPSTVPAFFNIALLILSLTLTLSIEVEWAESVQGFRQQVQRLPSLILSSTLHCEALAQQT
jgi:hypothetical protein